MHNCLAISVISNEKGPSLINLMIPTYFDGKIGSSKDKDIKSIEGCCSSLVILTTSFINDCINKFFSYFFGYTFTQATINLDTLSLICSL